MAAYSSEAERLRVPLPQQPGLPDLVRYATLAPNSHNTQPWSFAPTPLGIAVLPDFTRRCPVVDPDDHHVFVSLGCAAENMVIAANARGRAAEAATESASKPAQIHVALGQGAITDGALCDAIPHRQSTRALYDGQPLSPAELRQLEQAGTMPGVGVQILTDRRAMERVLEYVIQGNSLQCDNPAFVRELKHWMRFNADAAIAAGDGLFTACSGNRTAPTWLGSRLFDQFFSKASENEKIAGQMRSSAGIAIFVAERADAAGWMQVGRSFQRFALTATAIGLCHAHLNMPVEVAAIRADFARAIGATGQRPDLVVRFGRGKQLPMSLRRPVSSVWQERSE